MTLRLSPDLELPDNFATEGVAVIGMRGSGKSNTEVRWFEVCFDAGIPCVAVDPKGDWGGIRSSADGKKPGLPVAVFGGLMATDGLPLEERLGKSIADLLVDENMSAVLDVSRLSIAARGRFLTDFFNELIDRHQREPHVRCVILEEAHRYIPQQTNRDTSKVKEAAAAVLLEGRAFGLGCWAATQRPARLHKDVLEEVGTAIIHRIGTAASNDLKTITGWVKHEELGDEIVPSLTKLASGEAWVLAPSTLGVAKRVKIDRRHTFDSAATPIVGAGSRPVVTLADVDTGAIKEALADAIEKAKASDPAELTKRIRDLERELATARKVQPAPDPIVETVEVQVPFVPTNVVEAAKAVEANARRLADSASSFVDIAAGLSNESADRTPARTIARIRPPSKSTLAQVSAPSRRDAPVGTGDLPAGEHKILTAIAQHGDGVTREQLTILTGYKRSSRDTYLQRLRARGFIDMTGGRIVATDTGIDTIGSDFEPLPTGAALRDHWLERLPEGERRILAELVDAYPHGVPRDELSDRTEYKRSSRDTYLQRLRARQLITTDGDPRVSDGLFEGPS